MRFLTQLLYRYRERRRLRGVPGNLPPYLMRNIGLEPRVERSRPLSTLLW
ncbi:hypothetical protein [Roseovarius ramblicola]|uniref:DUF1127 domain-containing protein n=1 Tax=Roseovarius ramblicola TaxID=2022336 RepID=A0ABV5I4Y9_9RHOB